MRVAGCVINDYADRNIDGHLARTLGRPLVTGKISSPEALVTFAISAFLVLLTNGLTFFMSFGGLALAAQRSCDGGRDLGLTCTWEIAASSSPVAA
jgi:4-hydroxybenzoate polyprenyltransferase